jgi:hypothetical protein
VYFYLLLAYSISCFEFLNICSSYAETPGVTPTGNPIEAYNRWGLKINQTTMNTSLANFIEQEMPALLKREGRRSLKMKAGKLEPQTRETPFSLFVANCCMDPTLDSKLYDDGTGRELYLTNTALTAGEEITEERVAAYQAARKGDKKYFASENRTPREQVRDSVFATSGFCCVLVNENNDLVGNCQKCIKKIAFGCPSVLNVRKRIGAFQDNEDPKTLMYVYSDGKSTRNGNSQSPYLSGKAKTKAKKKSTLMHDPGVWLKQRNDKYLYETCLGLMILPKREADAIDPTKFKIRPELIAQLLKFADHPQAFRKSQEDQRQLSADREMGAYGYSTFTSVLHEEMDAQKKWNDEAGFKKPKQEQDDDISCDSMEEEEGFAETKNNSGKSELPFTVTQEEDYRK